MSTKPRRLHSVPTGPDVTPGDGRQALPRDSPTPTDTQALMERIDQSRETHHVRSEQPDAVSSPRRPRPPRPVTLRIRVDIEGITPPIWRRLDIASDLTLDRLDAVLQLAFGWQNSHLHSFTTPVGRYGDRGERYLTAFDVAEGDDGIFESAVELGELLVDAGDTLSYTYDFGDDWEHTLILESVQSRSAAIPRAVLLAGRRAGPPEDCGGVRGYQELLSRGAAAGDPEHLDIAGITTDLARLDVGGTG
jgi:hypothetical protein